MDNPYGLANLWAQGDVITRTVALGLLLMSILSWSVIAIKTWQLIRLRKAIPIAAANFWHSKNLEQGLDLLRNCGADNPFHQLAQAGMNAAAHHADYKDDLQGTLNISDWITSCLRRAIDDVTTSLQSGLPWLASIGSTAPFVGLFGTVWGIYHALIGISLAGQASIDKVAGPVGEALIMTAFGLAVAIPAVLGFNALNRANKGMLTRLNRFAHDLHAYFVTGGRLIKPLKKTSA
jgi:biopolymer transport protein ExbB